MPGYPGPHTRPTSPGNADGIRHYAGQLRKAARSLQTISDDADSWVYFYAEQWDGRWRDQFLSMWDEGITGNDQLNSSAWAQARADFVSAHPRSARLYDLNSSTSRGAFRVAIDACNQMAGALDQYAHAIDQEVAQEWTIFLDVLIIGASIVVTALSFGALGPEALMVDLFLVGATIGGVTSAAIDFTNQTVNNMVVGHDSFFGSFGHLDLQELASAYITGYIVGGVSSVVGMGLPRLLTSMGGVFKAAVSNTVVRIGVDAVGFGAGTFVGDITAQEYLDLLTKGRLGPADWGTAGKDALIATGGGVLVGTVFHGLHAPDATAATDPTAQKWGMAVNTFDESGQRVTYLAEWNPGSGRFDVTTLDASGMTQDVAAARLVDGTFLADPRGSFRIDLSAPGTDVLVKTPSTASWISVGKDGTPSIVREVGISDGAVGFKVVRGEGPLHPDLQVDPNGNVKVPRGWQFDSQPRAGVLTLTDPATGESFRYRFGDQGSGAEPKVLAGPASVGGEPATGPAAPTPPGSGEEPPAPPGPPGPGAPPGGDPHEWLPYSGPRADPSVPPLQPIPNDAEAQRLDAAAGRVQQRLDLVVGQYRDAIEAGNVPRSQANKVYAVAEVDISGFEAKYAERFPESYQRQYPEGASGRGQVMLTAESVEGAGTGDRALTLETASGPEGQVQRVPDDAGEMTLRKYHVQAAVTEDVQLRSADPNLNRYPPARTPRGISSRTWSQQRAEVLAERDIQAIQIRDGVAAEQVMHSGPRWHDAEFKLAQEIVQTLRAMPEPPRGTIVIGASKDMCPSCVTVLHAVQDEFPNVRVALASDPQTVGGQIDLGSVPSEPGLRGAVEPSLDNRLGITNRDTPEYRDLRAYFETMQRDGPPLQGSVWRSQELQLFNPDGTPVARKPGEVPPVLQTRYDVIELPGGETSPPKLEITVRMNLASRLGVTDEELARVRQQTQTAVDHFFNSEPRHMVGDAVLEVRVQIDDPRVSAPHFDVTVRPGAGRAHETDWFVGDNFVTRGHEVSHMLGLRDEYPENGPTTIDRLTPTSPGVFRDGSLMGDYWQRDGVPDSRVGLKDRHLAQILQDVRDHFQAYSDRMVAADGVVRRRLDWIADRPPADEGSGPASPDREGGGSGAVTDPALAPVLAERLADGLAVLDTLEIPGSLPGHPSPVPIAAAELGDRVGVLNAAFDHYQQGLQRGLPSQELATLRAGVDGALGEMDEALARAEPVAELQQSVRDQLTDVVERAASLPVALRPSMLVSAAIRLHHLGLSAAVDSTRSAAEASRTLLHLVGSDQPAGNQPGLRLDPMSLEKPEVPMISQPARPDASPAASGPPPAPPGPSGPALHRARVTGAAEEVLRAGQVEERERLLREQQQLLAQASPAEREAIRLQYAEARRLLVQQQDLETVGLRILALCTEWDPHKGGVVSVNRNLCLGLAEAGHEVFCRVGHEVAPGAGEGAVQVIGPRVYDPSLDERDQLLSEATGLPTEVDVVIGHSRFSGPAAVEMRKARYTQARLVHVVHMVTDALGRVQGRPERGLENQAVELRLVGEADLAVGVGPALYDEVQRLAAMSGSNPAFHELVPGVAIEERLPRPAGERKPNVLLFGRADDAQKGAAEAAMMIRELGKDVDVRLTVRGAQPETVARTKRMLSELAGREVEVRPYTVDRAEILADMQEADVVIMPSRAEGFGLVGLEAAGAGVPILVPSTSGIGRFVTDPTRFPADVGQPSVVEQGFEEPVPVGRWVDRLREIVSDLPAAQARALTLQRLLREANTTWKGAAQSLVAAVEALAERLAPALPPDEGLGDNEPPSRAAHG